MRSILIGVLLAIAAGATAAEPPTETVDAFHAALRSGDRVEVLALLTQDVTIYEQGFVERSSKQYEGDHLNADIEFAQAVTRTVLRRESWQDDNAAWVISETETAGRFKDQPVRLVGTETMILKRDNDAWKIAHIHWSAHSGL